MNVHRTLFYTLLFLLPTQLTKHFFIPSAYVSGIRIDYLAPVIYATDILVGALLIFWLSDILFQRKLNPRVSRVQTFLLAGIFLFAVINIIGALSPTTTFFAWLRIGEMILLALYVASTKPPLSTSILFIVLSGIYSALLAWGQWYGQSSVSSLFYWIGERTFTISTPGIARTVIEGRLFLRPYATFPHPNVLSGYLVALLPFTLYFQRSKNPRLRLAWLPMYILFISTIVITFSHSAWVIAGSMSLLLVSLAGKWKWRKVIAGIGVFLFLIGVFIYKIYPVEKESFVQRVKLANTAVLAVQNHPITGVGLNNFIIAVPGYQDVSSYQDLQPVHTIYLLLLSEVGIGGFLFFLGLLIILFRRLDSTPFSGKILLLSIASLLLLGLTDHYLLTGHQTILLFSILAGFAFAEKRPVLK